ncbi:MAG TPA: hypothetical protein VI198_02140 [Candidatus Eisenbacteria bacterium]
MSAGRPMRCLRGPLAPLLAAALLLGAPASRAGSTPDPADAPSPVPAPRSLSGPRVAAPPVLGIVPESPAHGNPEGLSWGGHGELRLGHDRVRGTSDPEWFSVGRVNGFARARLSARWRLAGEGTWDRATDDFVLERVELAYRWKRTLHAHGGIFPVPLGKTNLNHDAPKNDFAEHSLVATQLIGVPNAMLGLGVRGVSGRGARPMTYELDLVTGFSDGLILDSPGGTRLPIGRNNYGDNNGLPSLVGRIAFHPSSESEWGLAAQSGPYNRTEIGGVTVDDRRWVHLIVADGATAFAGFRLAAEGGVAFIDVPPGLLGLYAEDQWGASMEASRTLWDPLFGSWKESALRVAVRADAVDLDRGLPGDSRHRVSASLNIHHRPRAVARFGWYYELQRDRFDNETPHAGLTFTAATYF